VHRECEHFALALAKIPALDPSIDLLDAHDTCAGQRVDDSTRWITIGSTFELAQHGGRDHNLTGKQTEQLGFAYLREQDERR
jgi:hypothetical protein